MLLLEGKMVDELLIEEQFNVDYLFLQVLRRFGNEDLLNQPTISGKHLVVARIGFKVFPKKWFVAHRVSLREITPASESAATRGCPTLGENAGHLHARA